MSDTHDNDMAEFATQTSPGNMLKRERERQGMSLDEAAVALNLRPAVVHGLETDRYDEVPIVAYRRGYLRTYARLLGIDDKSVISAYNAQFGSAETERKVTPVHVNKPPSRLGAWLFKLVTLLVVLGLIGLTLLWWQSRGGNDLQGIEGNEPVAVDTIDGTTINEGDETPPAGEALPPLPADRGEMGLVDDQPPAEPGPVMTADADLTTPPPSETEAEAAIANTPPVEPEGEPLPADSNETVTDSSETAAEPEESAAEETAATSADPRVIELTFNEQSWTEIFDANNQRVFVGLQVPGTPGTAEGQPPFRLTVGNASGVELRYLGEEIDLTTRAGTNNVARFTLGE